MQKLTEQFSAAADYVVTRKDAFSLEAAGGALATDFRTLMRVSDDLETRVALCAQLSGVILGYCKRPAPDAKPSRIEAETKVMCALGTALAGVPGAVSAVPGLAPKMRGWLIEWKISAETQNDALLKAAYHRRAEAMAHVIRTVDKRPSMPGSNHG